MAKTLYDTAKEREGVLPQDILKKLTAHQKIVLGVAIGQEVERLIGPHVRQAIAEERARVAHPPSPWTQVRAAQYDIWLWLHRRLRQFCNTWEEWHAGVDGALWPTACWLVWAVRGEAPEGQLRESMRDEAAYVGVGITLRLVVIGGLLLWLAR